MPNNTPFMRPVLLLCLLLAATSVGIRADPPLEDESSSPLSRYHRTIQSLQQAPPQARTAFATIALSELAEAYMAEADLARNEAERDGGSDKLLGWSRAVDQYASQMVLVLEDLDLGFPVELSQGRDSPASLSVAGRVVILSHPRADQQATFEQRVLLDFCSRADCQVLTANTAPPEPIPLSASQVKPDWTFGEDGPVCSHDGIQLAFDTARNLAHWRAVCVQMLQEAVTLASEIAWQQRHGVSVDWSVLEIRPTPQRPEHLVRLNRAGDSILATLPLLYGSPGLLGDLKPWIRSRFSGEMRADVRLQAARYGWEDVGQ